jgi:hypothetical protein
MTSFQARLLASQIDVTYPCSSPNTARVAEQLFGFVGPLFVQGKRCLSEHFAYPLGSSGARRST